MRECVDRESPAVLHHHFIHFEPWNALRDKFLPPQAAVNADLPVVEVMLGSAAGK
jgi:hypothetical protein